MVEVIPVNYCEGSLPDPDIMEQAAVGRSLAGFPAARVGQGSGPWTVPGREAGAGCPGNSLLPELGV